MGVFQVAPNIRYYVENRMAEQLIKKKILVTKKDRDWFAIVDGEEGSGKSFLAIQLAKFVDPTFCLARIAFNGREFIECIRRATKGQAIVFDEAFTGLSARSSMSEINKLLVETIMEVRKKNLFIFIVLPSIFYLDRYVVLARARVLIHAYFKRERRGNYAVFDKKQIKDLILLGRKTMTYQVVHPKMHGKFTGRFALDVEGSNEKEKIYEQKKIEAINVKGMPVLAEKHMVQRNILFYFMHREGWSVQKLREVFLEFGFPLSTNTIEDVIKQTKKVLLANKGKYPLKAEQKRRYP